MGDALKVVALIGEPATGKSTILREVLRRLSPGSYFKEGLVFGTAHFKEKVFVLGTYDEGIFSGTDRFSMAVQPKAKQFLIDKKLLMNDWTVLFEGDRIGNAKFFSFCEEESEFKLFITQVSECEKHRRHKERNDTQSEKFLRGRKTKIENLKRAFPDAEILSNETTEESSGNVMRILSEITGGR